MRILLIHQYFLEEEDPGGSRWNEMLRMWSEQGHSVTVIAGMMHANGDSKRPEYKGKYFKRNQQGKIEVWRCHVSESYNKGFAGRLWGYFSFMFSSTICGTFNVRGKFDIVIVTSPPLFVGFSGYLISLMKNAPMLFEVRDLWPESAIDTGVLKSKILINFSYWFEAFIYRKSKLINTLTPAFYTILKEKKSIPEAKLLMIPNAADFSLSEALLSNFNRHSFRKMHGLDNHFVITYVGAHGIANHLDQVLDAAETLTDTNVLFLLIGQGMEKERLRTLASSRKINNVRFLDPVSKKDVFKYILASEVGLSVLKKVDTFKTVYSNKTFDYMSCKKPILMAIDGVSRQLVEDAEAGTYVEPENIASFETAIRKYLNDSNLIARQGEAGYRFAKRYFDRDLLSEKYLNVIKSLTNNT